MTATVTRVSFELRGVPTNWSNRRTHHMERYVAQQEWRRLSWLQAQQARNRNRWPLPTPQDSKRSVTFTIYKSGKLFDPDGAVSSIKPVLDGLIGVLVYDDSAKYVDLVVRQVHVRHHAEQRTVVELALI